MKQNLTLLLLVLCVCIGNGQNAISECAKKQISVDSLLVANEFREANDVWNDLRKTCSKQLSEDFYKSGEILLRYNIEMADDSAKEDAIKELSTLFDDYDRKFPANKNGNNVRKAVILHNNKMGSRADIYNLLDKTFRKTPSQFTDAEALYLYFDIYHERYLKGDDKITFEQIFERFEQIQTHVISLIPDASPQEQNVYQNLVHSLDALMESVIKCENLIEFYTKYFDSKKADAVWLSNAGQQLLKSNCTIDPVFLKITEAAHILLPTAKTAYNLAIANFRVSNNLDAAKYFEQAATLNTNPVEKADIYYTLAATIYNSTDKSKAKENLLKAIQTDPTFAKPYLLLSQMYGASGADCGANPFEKKAIYWLAAETARKAGQIDPKYKAGTDKMAESYKKKAPTSAEIKEAKMSGKVVTFKCWINESIAVPKI